ncbi:MAG: hypothetical protein RL172_800 [Bacteroidota bacterium]
MYTCYADVHFIHVFVHFVFTKNSGIAEQLFLRMNEKYLLKKIFIYALLSSPFFGLLGSTPGLTSREIDWQRTLRIFLLITAFTFFFWVVNILLLWLSAKSKLLINKAVRFVVCSVICMGIVYLLFAVIQPLPPPQNFAPHNMPGTPPQRNHIPAMIPLTQAMSINIIIFVLIELLILKDTKRRVAIENEQLKLANLEARNNQLKQQLHPHFLFNSLSTLRSLISRSPEQAEGYLDKLSELLRFSTNNSQQALVALQEEVELCTNYLNMQRVRFGEALFFSIHITEHMRRSAEVPVYSLQLLAENAIKHNTLTKEKPLIITIEASSNQQYITVKNNLQPRPVLEPANGVGLSNLSERYRMLDGTDIQVFKSPQYFSVSIKAINYAGNYN